MDVLTTGGERNEKRYAAAILTLILFSVIACEGKTQEPQPVGNLEITAAPSPLIVSSQPGDYIITTTGRETGGKRSRRGRADE